MACHERFPLAFPECESRYEWQRRVQLINEGVAQFFDHAISEEIALVEGEGGEAITQVSSSTLTKLIENNCVAEMGS